MPVYTLGDIIARVYDRLDQNTELYGRPEVITEINDSVRVTNLFIGYIQATVPLPGFTVANQIIYSLPDGILYPTRLEFEGFPLRMYSLMQMAKLHRSWLFETTANSYQVSHWVPIDMTTIAIHPADALGGQNLVFTGVAEPTALSLDTDILTVEDEIIEMIEELTAYNLIFKEGGKEFQATQQMYKSFLSRVKVKARWRMTVCPRFFLNLKAAEVAEQTGEE